MKYTGVILETLAGGSVVIGALVVGWLVGVMSWAFL